MTAKGQKLDRTLTAFLLSGYGTREYLPSASSKRISAQPRKGSAKRTNNSPWGFIRSDTIFPSKQLPSQPSRSSSLGPAPTRTRTAKGPRFAALPASSRMSHAISRPSEPFLNSYRFMGPMYVFAITTLSMKRCWSYGDGKVPPW